MCWCCARFRSSLAWRACAAGRSSAVPTWLECLRPRPDVLPIASHYFHGREIDYLRQVPASAASDAFLRLWTMKEAYIKCVGMGLSLPLDSFSVLDENLRKEYVIASIEAPADFVGAVAYPAPALEHISLSAG